jgi:putative transposase
MTPERCCNVFLRDVISCARQGVIRDLDKAWQMGMKPDFGRPKFKKYGDSVGIRISNAFNAEKMIRHNTIKLSKIGWVPVVIHRPLAGNPKTLSVVREGSAWYVSICTEIELSDPGKSDLPVVAIDRGVAISMMDSDGRGHCLSKKTKRLGRKVDRMQSAADKHGKLQKRSKRWEKKRKRVSQNRAKVANQRRYWLHSVANYYAENYGIVVLEELKTKNMTKSAKGDKENPGKNVKAKSGLNRSILEQGWYAFQQMLCYKMEAVGGLVVTVPPHHTSTICNECGYQDKNNRKDQSNFRCLNCGAELNADYNAALNIKQRFLDGDYKIVGGYNAKQKPKKSLRIVKKMKKKNTDISVGKGKSPALPSGENHCADMGGA